MAYCFHHLFFCFTWQSKDYMDNYRNAAVCKRIDSLMKAFQRKAAADKTTGICMDSL